MYQHHYTRHKAPKHDPLIKWPTWGHITSYRLLNLGRIFSMQALKSSPNFKIQKIRPICKAALNYLSDKSNGIRTHNHLVRKRNSTIFPNWPVLLNGWMFVYKLSGCGFESRCCHLKFKFTHVSSNKFLDIQATVECRLTLKNVRGMMVTYSQTQLFVYSAILKRFQ